MHQVILICDGFFAFIARLRPRLTLPQMHSILGLRHIHLAILTKLGLSITGPLMLGNLTRPKFLLTVLAFGFLMELLLVLLNEIDVIQLMAGGAALNVPPAVAIVGGHFGFGELLHAVVTLLNGFFLHL